MSTADTKATAAKGQDAAATAEAPAAAAPPADVDAAAADEDAESECPICKFVQAGPCGEGHEEWQACRKEAKQEGVDFVQHCSQAFRTFFGCMLEHQDYYQPFLEAFHVDVDKSQEAIEKGKGQNQHQSQQQQAQQQQQHQQQLDKPEQQQQQQQQQTQSPAGTKQASSSSKW